MSDVCESCGSENKNHFHWEGCNAKRPEKVYSHYPTLAPDYCDKCNTRHTSAICPSSATPVSASSKCASCGHQFKDDDERHSSRGGTLQWCMNCPDPFPSPDGECNCGASREQVHKEGCSWRHHQRSATHGGAESGVGSYRVVHRMGQHDFERVIAKPDGSIIRSTTPDFWCQLLSEAFAAGAAAERGRALKIVLDGLEDHEDDCADCKSLEATIRKDIARAIEGDAK